MADAILSAAPAAPTQAEGHSTDERSAPEQLAFIAYKALTLDDSPTDFRNAVRDLIRSYPQVVADGIQSSQAINAFADALHHRLGSMIAAAAAAPALAPFNLDAFDLENADHLVDMAHALCCQTINDPGEHEALLEGAKALLEKARAIMIAERACGMRNQETVSGSAA